MSQFRLVALLPLVTAAGCYNDAASQSTLPSTQPEPQYVSGPPGGAIDPGYRYPPYADTPAREAAEPPTADNTPVPLEMPAMEGAPSAAAPAPGLAGPALAPDTSEDGEEVVEVPPPEGAPTDPTSGVTDAEIGATLDGYGQWIDTDDYGQVWRPDATVVGVDFTPYESGGSWAYTDAGWAFSCDYHWGWLPFHYGRWAWFHDYWGWVPGHRWGPAWVEWRHGGGIVGWRPMAPRLRDHRSGEPSGHDFHYGSGPLIRDHRSPEQHDSHWRFATASDFGRPHVRSHLYGNLAEGLRVTSTVSAPPLRARSTVHAGDLMRNRFAAGGRLTQPGPVRYSGPPQLRDHRSSEPVRAYQPAMQGDRSLHTQPYDPAVRTYQPPATYRPPVRTQPYNPPAATYRPPVRAQPYNPPVRSYQPPVRSYPPVRTAPPPARAFAPPARSSSPPASSGSSHGSSSSSSGSSGSHSSGGGGSHSSGGGGGGHHR